MSEKNKLKAVETVQQGEPLTEAQGNGAGRLPLPNGFIETATLRAKLNGLMSQREMLVNEHAARIQAVQQCERAISEVSGAIQILSDVLAPVATPAAEEKAEAAKG